MNPGFVSGVYFFVPKDSFYLHFFCKSHLSAMEVPMIFFTGPRPKKKNEDGSGADPQTKIRKGVISLLCQNATLGGGRAALFFRAYILTWNIGTWKMNSYYEYCTPECFKKFRFNLHLGLKFLSADGV